MNSELRQIAADAFNAVAEAAGQVGVFTGTRREAGASSSRPMSHSVLCVVSEALAVDLSNLSSVPSSEVAYTVEVGRNTWPDHLPPQAGDSVLFDDIPVLKVSAVLPTAFGWSLDCRSKGGVP